MIFIKTANFIAALKGETIRKIERKGEFSGYENYYFLGGFLHCLIFAFVSNGGPDCFLPWLQLFPQAVHLSRIFYCIV